MGVNFRDSVGDQGAHWRKCSQKGGLGANSGRGAGLVSRGRGWRFPGWPGGRFSKKSGFSGNTWTVLGDVGAPQTTVGLIRGARGVFYGRGGLISPAPNALDFLKHRQGE